jgi:hypothetical protein
VNEGRRTALKGKTERKDGENDKTRVEGKLSSSLH